ncbi:hypothetical protein C0995_005246 [Termitomyces sp. Mi166|nr:hypothetical protein C0995_005246 [Termitomyces sp. Mi166\
MTDGPFVAAVSSVIIVTTLAEKGAINATTRLYASNYFGLLAPRPLGLSLMFEVERDKILLKRISGYGGGLDSITVSVKGLISKFPFGGGRSGTNRQFFYVNGRPCNMIKIQKAFNEVYPTDCSTLTKPPLSLLTSLYLLVSTFRILSARLVHINVSPDKRTIFLPGKNNIITKLKTSLEKTFAPSQSKYDIGTPQNQRPMIQATLPVRLSTQEGHVRIRIGSKLGVEMRMRMPKGSRDGSSQRRKQMAQRSSSPPVHLLKDAISETGNGRAVSPLPVGPSPVERSELLPLSGGRSSATERSDHAPSATVPGSSISWN